MSSGACLYLSAASFSFRWDANACDTAPLMGDRRGLAAPIVSAVHTSLKSAGHVVYSQRRVGMSQEVGRSIG